MNHLYKLSVVLYRLTCMKVPNAGCHAAWLSMDFVMSGTWHHKRSLHTTYLRHNFIMVFVEDWQSSTTHATRTEACTNPVQVWLYLELLGIFTVSNLYHARAHFTTQSQVCLSSVIAACCPQAWFTWLFWKRWAWARLQISVISNCAQAQNSNIMENIWVNKSHVSHLIEEHGL